MTDARDARDPQDRGFETLFRENHAWLCDVVYGYVRSNDVAEDIVQDLFLSIWQVRGAGTVPEITKAYLYTAARNRALKHLRHGRVVQRFAERAVHEEDRSAAAADEAVREREVAAAAETAIAELPERCREVFVLRRHRHMTNAEIAATLGISVKTVEVQMWRALSKLRERLAPFLAMALVASL